MDDTLSLAMRIAASGMHAQRMRIDVIAQNIANAEATRTETGAPYRRRQVIFAAIPIKAKDFEAALWQQWRRFSGDVVGVRVVGVAEDPRPFREVFDPGHPDADARGIVKMPNVNVVEEMVDLTSASRGFEANATVMEAAKKMFARTIDLLR